MHLARSVTLFFLALVLEYGRSIASAADAPALKDIHSFSRPDQIAVKRVELDLKVDFEQKELRGSATLSVERQPGCPSDAPLRLDTRGLLIETVSGVDEPARPIELTHKRGAADRILGTPLTVELPSKTTRVKIDYKTTLRSQALLWLEPAGTAGKKSPFVFTQSEAIQARSWIPLQDSPSVRVTYAATIQVPAPLTAVMGAELKSKRETRGRRTFSFEMPQTIPPYLIALAIGDLEFRELGPRTGVYAEPSVVEAAAREFVDNEAMVATVEKRFGPYRWGRYDILVLPPSFPFGGMENPRLTFATPTILAGDRSLVALVAHELAHSWSGNLVTNATWRDFWLNEGFTTYLERRVMEDLYGRERATMERVLGLAELREELGSLPPRDQVLHIDLAGRDPDDAMTRIPYEKGSLFLSTLEAAFGRARFDSFLRGYFEKFAFQSITTEDFVAYFREHLSKSDEAAAGRVDLRAWIEEPGLPAGFPSPVSDRLEKVAAAARGWAGGELPIPRIETMDWSTQEWLQFLRSLPRDLSVEKLAALDKAFDFTNRGNSEVVHQWLLIAVRNHYSPADARLESFLTTIGRRKFLVPLYKALVETPEGRTRAKALLARARPFYHPMAVESIDKVVVKGE
jgi:aminopeptidase N